MPPPLRSSLVHHLPLGTLVAALATFGLTHALVIFGMLRIRLLAFAPAAVSAERMITLGDILAAAGGQPINVGYGLRPAFIIPHGQTLRLTATLRDTAAALVGGESNYGVSLGGVFLSRATRRAE